MTWVCTECGSDRVYFDGWVGVNDPTDVQSFDDTHCNDCGGACDITEATNWRITKSDDSIGRSEWPYEEWWSNDLGWTTFDQATCFTEGERRSLNLPVDGEWVGS